MAIPTQKTSGAGRGHSLEKKGRQLASVQLKSCSQKAASSAVPPRLLSKQHDFSCHGFIAWVIHCFSGLISLVKGLLVRGPEVIGFMGREELSLRPAVFPVGIKVTSFLLFGLKIAIS